MKTTWAQLIDGRVEDQAAAAQWFSEYLTAADAVRDLLDSRGVSHPVCFISYAWEKDRHDTDRLHLLLKFFKSVLHHLGARVYLDIQDMHANMAYFMDQRIEESDWVFLMGTPCLKESLLDPDRNISREYRQIQSRLPQRPELLVPILVRGNYAEAYPDALMKEQLVRDFRGLVDLTISWDSLDQLAKALFGLENPVGIIPMIYKTIGQHPDYVRIVRTFMLAIQNLRLQRYVTNMGVALCEVGNTAVVNEDYATAHRAFEAAAQAQHIGAMIRLAQLLAYGHGPSGTLLDMLKTACTWSEKARRAARDPAEKESAIRVDQQVHRKYQEYEANQGDPQAMYRLANMLFKKQGVSQPRGTEENAWKLSLNTSALTWLNKAKATDPKMSTTVTPLIKEIEIDCKKLRLA